MTGKRMVSMLLAPLSTMLLPVPIQYHFRPVDGAYDSRYQAVSQCRGL
jgi:hypothetical protein